MQNIITEIKAGTQKEGQHIDYEAIYKVTEGNKDYGQPDIIREKHTVEHAVKVADIGIDQRIQAYYAVAEEHIHHKPRKEAYEHTLSPSLHKAEGGGQYYQQVRRYAPKRYKLKKGALQNKAEKHQKKFYAFSDQFFFPALSSLITSTVLICLKSTPGVSVPDFVRLFGSLSIELI